MTPARAEAAQTQLQSEARPETGPAAARPGPGHPGGENGRALAGASDEAPGAASAAPRPEGETDEWRYPIPPAPPRPDIGAESTTLNRDLSWLEFNRRVLHLGIDQTRPLLERVKFLAIFSSNLDEFIMKRVGFLKKRLDTGFAPTVFEPWPVAELIRAIRGLVQHLQAIQTHTFETSVRPGLAREGIELLVYEQLTEEERQRVDRWFAREVFPVLTPLAVDTGHRFPFISNLSENIGVLVKESDHAEPLFARIKVPAVFPQWVRVPAEAAPAAGPAPGAGRGRFVHLSEVIRNNLDDLFPGMRIVEVATFRVYRNAEVEPLPGTEPDDDTDNLLELVEAQLRKRRFAAPVRLEMTAGHSQRMARLLMEELSLAPEDVETREGLLEFGDLNEIVDLDRPDLKDPPWRPVPPPRLAGREKDFFSVIREGDLLVHHPYESFEHSAQRFIAEAARDPSVLAIKQTIYRTSRDSPFISSLVRAAESGKQVACLVELRARFDEQNNVRVVGMLEKAGVHVAYGVVGLKTHCKASIVVRREPDGLRTYAHLGTGNYHPRTAQLYTDFSLFTCDPLLTDDAADLFNFLTGRSRKEHYRSLLVAPITMKSRILELIDQEIYFAGEQAAGRSEIGGRIVAKMNALEDHTVTQKLYEASRAGVQITL
ncbi:MAG TPA: polyphosphate kinase 1, partial [Phycisphaerales bacterium]|nr:polyphosphate kinase 1 [Phycisphaerales bacterium]